jgi:hypothetical protein
MSKMDGLRAMREARYEQAAARVAQPKVSEPKGSEPKASEPKARKPAAAPKGATRPAPAPAEAQGAAAEAESLPCGHRNMSGRTCTREQGHAAKSHRYS